MNSERLRARGNCWNCRIQHWFAETARGKVCNFAFLTPSGRKFYEFFVTFALVIHPLTVKNRACALIWACALNRKNTVHMNRCLIMEAWWRMSDIPCVCSVLGCLVLCPMVIGLWQPIHVFFILDSGGSQICLASVLAVAATAPQALHALPYGDWSVATNACSLHLRWWWKSDIPYICCCYCSRYHCLLRYACSLLVPRSTVPYGNWSVATNPCSIHLRWWWMSDIPCLLLPLMLLVANLTPQKMMQKIWKMIETLANGYSSERSQRELSNEYQHDRVLMVFKNLASSVAAAVLASYRTTAPYTVHALSCAEPCHLQSHCACSVLVPRNTASMPCGRQASCSLWLTRMVN